MGFEHSYVKALLDYFVDPMLPIKASTTEAPLYKQKLVAKQVHDVVLLYNYYLLKQCAGIKFLGFQEFSEIATSLKPTLVMAHMKLMQVSDNADYYDHEANVSVTEKAIMDACDLCIYLDASKEMPNIEGWPVSSVVVLLTDSQKQNCFLQFNSTTQGVWSLIEKSLDDLPDDFDGKMESKHVNKKQKKMKKTATDASNVDEAICYQLALYAVKEIAGINPSDLVVLESHVVYSLSKAKKAVRFYIMQTKQPLREDSQIPIQQILDSIQGPLIRKSSMWEVTPVVEYFHVLPYADILAEWFSRDEMQDLNMDVGSPRGMDVGSPRETDVLCDKEPVEVRDEPIKRSTEMNIVSNLKIRSSTATLQQKDNESFSILSNSSSGPQKYSSAVVHRNEKLSKEKNKVAPMKTVLRASIAESGKEKLGADTRVTLSNRMDVIEVSPVTLDSKKTFSRSALAVVFKERSRLCSQRQAVEEEIFACDKKIQEILDVLSGSVENLATMVKAFVEPCIDDDAYLEEQTDLQDASNKSNGKISSETVLCLTNSCQHLDDMCHENNWTLPTYNIKTSACGFTAHVNVKGTGFNFTVKGDAQPSSPLARGSAAKYVLANLLDEASKNQ
ncbi:uncharacterized protein LOC124921507 [Impatiens glandulifera]|uniref:uncharacterized protein LOC124921507 n=1 Tax=Impatiens glandulifera TaxID=253017 RepID=UPI001FB06757|nr:uncharacterized protein LOC124921507 [Impatiens glandulifera]